MASVVARKTLRESPRRYFRASSICPAFASSISLGCEAYRGFPCSVGATSSTPITVAIDGEQVVADFGLYVDGIFRDRME